MSPVNSNVRKMPNETDEKLTERKQSQNPSLQSQESQNPRKSRKYIPITPLPLDFWQKTDAEFRQFILPESSQPEPVKNEESSKPEPPQDESFDLSFLSVNITPKAEEFATPLPALKPAKWKRSLQFPSSSKKSTAPTPKVQFSLQTPIGKGGDPDNIYDFEAYTNETTPSFKKLYVKDVEYVVLDKIGSGGSSEVFHCFELINKRHRAVKCVSLRNKTLSEGFINEINILETLQDCNRIIKLYDYEIKDREKLLLVVLEIGGSDFSKTLKESAKNNGRMPLSMLLYYWMEMLYAVKQIHSHGIIHSDLKPGNFLNVDGYLKLIDFGISAQIDFDMTSVVKAVAEGSMNYISPEALRNESTCSADSPNKNPRYKVRFKSDVWSLGCILYQLAYGKTPFEHLSRTNIYEKYAVLMNPDHKINYPDVEGLPPRVINTIKKCLQYDSYKRPSIDDLILEYEQLFQSL